MITDAVGYLIASCSVLLAFYSMRCVCIAHHTGRNPRPFAFPMFVMLASAIIKFAMLYGGFNTRIGPDFAIMVNIIDFLMIAAIAWLLFHSTRRRS